MYQTKLNKLLFKILFEQKKQEERYIEIDYHYTQNNTFNLTEVLKDFANRQLFPVKAQVFYLDPLTKHFVYADFMKNDINLASDLFQMSIFQEKQRQTLSSYPQITILIKYISDQTLANPKKTTKKRSKERLILDVIRCCKQWRRLYRQTGSQASNNNKHITLDQSACLVGVARKTLEDYFLQLKNAKRLNFDFAKHKFSKMGVLRNYVKQNSNNLKIIKTQMQIKYKTKAQLDEQQQKNLFDFLDNILNKNHFIQEKEGAQQYQQMDVGQYLINSDSQSKSANSSQSEQ